MFLFVQSFIAIYAETICNGPDYSPLGCFTDDPPFGGLGSGRRGMLPNSVSTVRPNFYLSNLFGSDQEVDWQNPAISRFETDKPVVVTSHGWWSNDWWQRDADSYFRQLQNVNYIRLNWAGGANMDEYYQAASNTQIAGRAIAYLLNQLKQKGLNVHFHCAGHSLGSQVCGYAGKYTQSEFGWKMDRITGLDPAGPSFEGADVAVRIDKSDAEFVDILHTNGGALGSGMTAPIGHADFYPNGGKKQPGCGDAGHGSCSHDAAPNIWVDSIINIGCLHPACTENDFNNNNCPDCSNGASNQCNYMGHYSVKPDSPTSYYGTTAGTAPYC